METEINSNILFISLLMKTIQFVSDYENHRVMKWMRSTKEEMIVTGEEGQGNIFTKLSHPTGRHVPSLSL
jgi:hypothetical protein